MDTRTFTAFSVHPDNPLFPRLLPLARRIASLGQEHAKLITVDYDLVPEPIRNARLSAIELELEQLHKDFDALHLEAGITDPPLAGCYLGK